MDETLIAGRYEVRDLLGRGAGGTVLAAMDRRLRRMVALKLIRRPGLAEPAAREALERALREAQHAGRLSHPNILAVHDAGRCPDYAWIVHELAIGETLKAALERGGPPALPETVRIMAEVLSGLAAAHARGIVHRNVQPRTILLVERPSGSPDPGLGRVRLTDFGIARLAEAGLGVHGQAPPTPGSLAPEQLRGAPVDHRVDLWGAGILLYQLLTGARPFEGAPVSIMQAILEAAVPPPSLCAPGLPPGFDAVIARALAKRPGDRFPDAESMAEAIRVAAMPPGPPAVRRHHPQGLMGFLRRKRA